MKKYIVYPLLILIALIFCAVVGLAAVIFYKPEIILNPKNLNIALEKTKVLKTWSWREAKMDFFWAKWNDRLVSGYFYDFCFEYENESVMAKTCLEEISWDLNVLYDLKEGLRVKTLSPLVISSKKTFIAPKKDAPQEEDSGPMDIRGRWQMLWGDMIPEMDFNFESIEVALDKPLKFDLKLKKLREELNITALGFNLLATEKKIEVLAPPHYRLPHELFKGKPLHLNNVKLTALMNESKIPLEVTGALEIIDIIAKARIDLPVKDDFSSVNFRKKILGTLTAHFEMRNIQENFKKFSPKNYPELPAPFNIMEGSIILDVKGKTVAYSDFVEFGSDLHVDLKSPKQALDVRVNATIPVEMKKFSPGQIKIDIGFNKVTLQLPRISKKARPPQFIPDSRIKNTPFGPKSEDVKKKEGPGLDLNFHLEALNEKALHLRTDLLDEELRLNFSLVINKSTLENGFVQILPLKTKVFKRPIRVQSLRVDFSYPLEPVIIGEILFPLPEYKITLKLEGPISKPSYSFTSIPPLPQNDIYAVLLFGRPLAELDPDDKQGAQKTNQILSQGILSLGVLYFLAGSPVEYVGYDPESKSATAQIGLGSKTSLRVGRGEGINSTGVRRSLGKGWYLDTSAQSSSTLSDSDSKSYGVMLERVIAY